jgi:L-asparagine transporter-like permease
MGKTSGVDWKRFWLTMVPAVLALTAVQNALAVWLPSVPWWTLPVVVVVVVVLGLRWWFRRQFRRLNVSRDVEPP